MPEKGSWSHTTEGLFTAPSDGDSVIEAASLVSNNSKMLSHCFKSSNINLIDDKFGGSDPRIGGGCANVDSDAFCYPLDHVYQEGNNVNFFDNDCANKETNDLLYYGLPDIGDVEEFDQIFRSCDSTMGLGGDGSEDELGWFSSTHVTEGSEDPFNSDFNFSYNESCPSKYVQDNHGPFENASSANNGFNTETASLSFYASRRLENDEPAALTQLSSRKEQIKLQKKQARQQNQSEGGGNGQCLENGIASRHSNNLQFKDMKLPSANSTRQNATSHQMHNIQLDSTCYLQTHTPFSHLDYSNPLVQVSVSPTLTSFRSDISLCKSFPRVESSNAADHMEFPENPHEHSFETDAMAKDDKSKKLHFQHGFRTSSSSNQKNDFVVLAEGKSLSVQKQNLHSDNKININSEVKATSLGVPGEVDSSILQEISCNSSVLGEFPHGATSFRQLQHVMEQLDTRSKLCIRDSLYRLARSAEQRHNYANLEGGSRDDVDTCGALTDKKANNGLTDIETNTNPIDRSIAHLLFHRPSGS